MAIPSTRPVPSYKLAPVLIIPSAGGVFLQETLLGCTTYDNDSNESTLTFRVSRSDPKADRIKEEMPVEFKGRKYVARTITVSEDRGSGDSYVEVYCERIWYNLIFAGQIDEKWVAATAGSLMNGVLAGTGWSVGQVDTSTTIGWQVEAGTVLNYLQQISKIYGGYLVFDDIEKKVNLLAGGGRDRGTSFNYYRGIKTATRRSDTTSLVTRLYGRNAEGETIASVNGGVPYVSNYTWTTDVRSATYDFKSGMSPQAMLRYLNSIIVARATPNISYKYRVSGLMDRIEEVDRFEVLDTVFVMDEEFSHSVRSQIVALTIDYIDPRRSTIELGNRVRSLSNSGNASSPSDVPPALVRKPSPPGGLATSSFIYFETGGEPRAELTAVYSPATVGTDGSPISITEHQLLGRRVVTPAEKFRVIASAPGRANEITRDGFLPQVPWEFQVRALASNGTVSESSASVFHTFSKDITAPAKPATPTATSRLGQVLLSVTNLDENGQQMPPDFSHFELRVATTALGASSTFSSEKKPGTFTTPDQPYNVMRWYSVVAVDTSGNKSLESGRVAIATKPLVDTDIIGRVIDGANLKLDSITDELLSAPIKATLASADGKSTVYYQTTAPTGGTYKDGDTWFDTDDGNKLYRRSGASWVAVELGSSALAAAVNTAISDAQSAATAAQTTADGKSKVIRSTAVPSGAGSLGDQWWRYSGSQIIGLWIHSGSAWVSQTLTDQVITNLNAGTITAGTLHADRIAAKSITGAKIAANTITANEMLAGTITASSGIIANAAISNAQIVSLDAGKINVGVLSAARIGAKTLTADKIAIGDFQNYALSIQNQREREAYPASGPWRYSKSGTVSPDGITSPWLVLLDNGATGYANHRVGEDFAVKPGEEIFISYRAQRRGASEPVCLNLQVFGEDNTVVAQDVFAARAYGNAANNVWITYSGRVVIPAGAAYARPMFKKNSNVGMTGGDWVLYEPIIRRVTTGELLVDGAVISRTIATDAVVARTIAANQIEAGHIKANAITADKIEAGAITTAKLAANAITADKIVVGAIDGKTITGAIVKTTATANRGIILDSARFSAYNNSGVETVRINASDGSATFTGTLRNRPSGPRVEMVASDTRARIYMHTLSATSQPPSIQADSTGDGIQMTSGTPSGTTQYSGVSLIGKGTDTHAPWGLGSLSSASWVGARITGGSNGVATMYGANGYMRVGSDGTCHLYRNSSQYLNFTSGGVTQAVATAFNVFGNFTVNNGTKNFVMDHPTKPRKQLRHASSESPHNGVEYWSDGLMQLPEDGQLTVTLPEYFEGLTAADHRSVMLTAGSPNANLWASPVEDGRFVVHGAPGALFYWLVKARRVLIAAGEDVLAFQVEQDAELLEPLDPELE